jgi:hypothetical protein
MMKEDVSGGTMAKKEENSKKQTHAKEDKIHGQKHEEPKLHGDKARGTGKEIAQGTGMWNADEKEIGKVKGPGKGDFDEKGFGGDRGRGMENLNDQNMAPSNEPDLETTGGTGVGDLGGIDISNYDPLASGNLGKKVAGKGCLPSIIGIIMVLALVIIF